MQTTFLKPRHVAAVAVNIALRVRAIEDRDARGQCVMLSDNKFLVDVLLAALVDNPRRRPIDLCTPVIYGRNFAVMTKHYQVISRISHAKEMKLWIERLIGYRVVTLNLDRDACNLK
ncbi:MAG: hypothetical protein L0Y55_00585 [Anaerolineales bacterium]|nr:hypothetical protein [Anaerolineales bacterium]